MRGLNPETRGTNRDIPRDRPALPASSTQLLLCVAPDWDAPTGRLQRFERSASEEWRPVGSPIAVTLGRNGMAWGRGLHPPMDGTRKCEGDGCAPAGVFAITGLFGYAAEGDGWTAGLRLPYFAARPGLKCVDDPASPHYNCLVDQAVVAADWASCEDMLRQDRRYEAGAVIAHNTAPPLPGAGSCIFLHVWETPDTPTAGCTAMSLADMQALATWLDGERQPLLVQLPDAEFAQYQHAWSLPRR